MIAHLRQQAAELGSPVSYRFYDSDWLDASTLEYYFSWPFVALAAAGLALVVWNRAASGAIPRSLPSPPSSSRAFSSASSGGSRCLRVPARRVLRRSGARDPDRDRRRASSAPLALGRRVCRRRSRTSRTSRSDFACPSACSRTARRDPRRSTRSESSASRSTRAASRSLVVADGCLGVRVPYLVQSADDDRVRGLAGRLLEARPARPAGAKAVLRGGPEGRRLAGELGVRYVVLDPRCTPNVEADLGGTTVVPRRRARHRRAPGRRLSTRA